MTPSKKSFVIALLCSGLFLLLPNYSSAQSNSVTIIGKLIDQESKQAIPYASVVLNNKQSKAIITGVTSDDSGNFSLTTTATNYEMTISYLGYTSITITEFTIVNNTINLKTIHLYPDNEALDEVVITGEVSKTVFKLDKRVFNVGKDISSTGVSALEVLNNVPSVNVNIEGQVSLRGSTGVQILINGKPSVLADQSSNALGSITADMIESIEVITNPSAKYDAEGTSGILNIILKKEEKKGLNGSVSINTGTPDNHSIGISLNRRTEKFNLFSQIGAGYRSLPQENESINTDLINNTTIFSTGTEYRNEAFYNLTLGTDYHINDYNVITLSGNFAYEVEDQPSRTNYSSYDENDALISEWFREETTDATNPKWQYELNYKKEFENNEDQVLLFSAIGSFFGKDQASEFNNTTISGTNANNDQQTETIFQQADFTFKIDYTHPFTEKITLETGAQYVINDVGNDYEVRDFTAGTFVRNDSLTNNFEYNQKVFGAYGTGAYEGNKWGVKVGLRIESTDLNTLLTNTNASNSQNYHNYFPTFHTSYQLSETLSVQAGYSKRIFRPRLWDLNPFFNIRNNFNVRTGNPNLQAEFSDSYELTSIFMVGKASMSTSLYYRYTTDVIERVSSFADNVNTTTPENIGTNGATGIEINGKYSPTNWISFTGDLNYNYFNREGDFELQSFDFSGDRWSSTLGTKIGLPAAIDFEITGNHQSNYKTVQGNVKGYVYADVGLRKKLLNGKAVINLGVLDLFRSRVSESYTLQPTFEVYNHGLRGRFVTLGFSYGFGKGEAMTYSGKRR
ncbi:TonB-dependent receptor family protein [Cellulophaga sp. F20128]|uniref:outer membrane beta-barrel family protein n=1 Tax=Cellulophaga sp. F20128 TaxID=2926413 RepID=UPI001FF58DF7|nr:outer membrane beta-barrel family protein [Cellulophaga sp. F20128]MCK0157025.1 TonB-dependent receptor family protein [Cellulophaga sp. F20128]